MAKRVEVTLLCDLPHDDGEHEATGTVAFGYEGGSYELDLCDSDAQALKEGLTPYLASARRATVQWASKAHKGGGRTPADRAYSTRVRQWAAGQSDLPPVNERGRIPGSIIAAYEARHTSAGNDRVNTPAPASFREPAPALTVVESPAGQAPAGEADTPKARNKRIREWAKGAGIKVNANGIIPRAVVTRYEAAHA